MGHTRLNSCAVCSVHVKVLDGTDILKLAEDFISRVEVRENLFGKFPAWYDWVWTVELTYCSLHAISLNECVCVLCCVYMILFTYCRKQAEGDGKGIVTKGKSRCVPLAFEILVAPLLVVVKTMLLHYWLTSHYIIFVYWELNCRGRPYFPLKGNQDIFQQIPPEAWTLIETTSTYLILNSRPTLVESNICHRISILRLMNFACDVCKYD